MDSLNSEFIAFYTPLVALLGLSEPEKGEHSPDFVQLRNSLGRLFEERNTLLATTLPRQGDGWFRFIHYDKVIS